MTGETYYTSPKCKIIQKRMCLMTHSKQDNAQSEVFQEANDAGDDAL